MTFRPNTGLHAPKFRPGYGRYLSALCSGAFALFLFALYPVAAQTAYPNRPVTLVVAFTPGGPSDVIARFLGEQLSKILGQRFVIENRPGAGGNIAAQYAAHAEPDGYTLLLGNNSILATNASLYKSPGFDAEKDFQPICLIGSQPNILVVRKDLPVGSVPELVAMAKAAPGKLSYASSGYGAAAHLAGELFKARAGIDVVHVPYKGAAPALQDLIGGRVDLMFATSASVVSHIESGSVRAFAVTGAERTPLLPQLPTIAELGFPGFEATTWHGLVAPRGISPEIRDQLHAAVVRALQEPQLKEQMRTLGVDIDIKSPDEFAQYIRTETVTWAAVVKAAGAKLE